MKYKLTFNWVGVKEEHKADAYYFQPPGVMLQKKNQYNSKVLRTDEKMVNFKFISLDGVLEFDIEELE